MRNKIKLIREVINSESVSINCFGGDDERRIWSYFNSRHPKLPLVRRKTFGACLRPVPPSSVNLLEGSHFTLMRRKVRKAEKAGFTFRPINPIDFFDDVMRINNSSGQRQ